MTRERALQKKVFIAIALSMLLLVGCNNKNEHIEVHSKDVREQDNINIILNDGWWVKDYSVDYENKQVILNIEREIE